jgi:hypothetical protein
MPAEANQVPEIFVYKACKGKDFLLMTSEKLSRRVRQFFPFKPD